MTRKNTIIVAVLVNAVLLTLLFVTAVTHDDEYYAQSQIPALDKEEKPIDFSLLSADKTQPVEQPIAVATPVVPTPVVPETPVAQEKIVHTLPEAVAQIPVENAVITPKEPIKLKEVIVKKGDSLEKIAKVNKVAIDDLIKVNNLPNTFLRIGQVLKLPEAGVVMAKASSSKEAITSSLTYVVKSGDNPWTIAMKHHIKVEELLRLNHLDKEKAKKLKPGDKLRIR